MNAHQLASLIAQSITGHADYATKPSKAIRKWDGKTPYGIHPVWCAMTVLTETSLPEDLRVRIAQALLFHDFLEDTTAKLPDMLTDGVRELVDEMTFESSAVEMQEVWSRSAEAKLAKVYDKTSNLLDGSWMTQEKRAQYADYLLRLCEVVEKAYGPLNIITIARAIAA